ncbi:hypothetical protein BGZ96_001576 [Linnemannia gamsii]|uniref:Uncharacterized protein n=1 Tax=Linnemannia gamsii TaxID=64522 RepID=A0ABQ7JLZ9_9FUNG|nr:hypothetical protein BGZ96_001576 [Linnemannia gamsii]
MKVFGSFTIALSMMVALTVAFIAGPVEAGPRDNCRQKCSREEEQCKAAAKPNCENEFYTCYLDCDG